MARPDPRAEPSTDPPPTEDVVEDSAVQRIVAPQGKRDAKDAGTVREKATDMSVDEVRRLLAGEKPAPVKITNVDPRVEELEKLLDANDWKGIARSLGGIEEIGKLPPNLGLVAALADVEGSKEASPETITTAIRCMAGLLGVSEDSPIARVLARRMLRKNPTRFSERQAPPARLSLLIVLVTLVVGGGVGFVLSVGSWQGVLHLFR
ncbi:MAG: hypothetical protein JST00_15660 [Deltaproteobacteria bacterium]|nr:hypothetical protein [Deltaproteobacteria bacterium]